MIAAEAAATALGWPSQCCHSFDLLAVAGCCTADQECQDEHLQVCLVSKDSFDLAPDTDVHAAATPRTDLGSGHMLFLELHLQD